MVNFIPVDPATMSTDRLGRRGRVSYPLIKQFLEATHNGKPVKVAKMDMAGLDRDPGYLRSVLTSYIKNHKIPVKIFQLQGDMHMMRLDIDNDGNPIENWQEEGTTEGAAGHERNLAPMPINAEEVSKRFKTEVTNPLK